MNGGNNRLGGIFDHGLRFKKARAFWLAAKFCDVGAGDEGAAVANEDDGLDACIVNGGLDAFVDTFAHIGGKRIHRGRIEREDGNIALIREIGYFIDCGHGEPPGCYSRLVGRDCNQIALKCQFKDEQGGVFAFHQGTAASNRRS